MIRLTTPQLKWCYNHACRIVEHYGGERGKGSGIYNHNKVHSNLVGVKGELATVLWLRTHIDDETRVKSNYESFSDSSMKGDINIDGQAIEVKSLRPHHWEDHRDKEPKSFRRMVPPSQLKHYVRANAILVWTTATGNILNDRVELKGWNWANEVQTHGRRVRTICDNVWLQDDSMMRAIESLPDVLASHSKD